MPLDLFERPATQFVAGFLGTPKMNFLSGRLERGSDGACINLGESAPKLALPRGRDPAATDGAKVVLGLRPEHVERVAAGAPAEGFARVAATIELLQPTGSRSYATFRLAGQPVVAELQAHDVSRAGEHISVDINLWRAALFDPATGNAL